MMGWWWSLISNDKYIEYDLDPRLVKMCFCKASLVNISKSYKKFHVLCGLWKENFWKVYDHWPLKHAHGPIADYIPDIKTERTSSVFSETLHNGGLLWGAWQDANNSWWPKYLGGLFDRSKEFNRRRCKVSTRPGNFDDNRKINRHKNFSHLILFKQFKFLSIIFYVSYLSPPVPYIVPILFSLIIIIGSIGNLLVVLVIYLNKTMRNNTNILILNLAVSWKWEIYSIKSFRASSFEL